MVGSSYTSSVTKFPECVMACAADRLCNGFNYDTNKTCTLMNAVNSSADFRGVTSGVKASTN
ncbi:PAN domain-containing protein [Rhizobiaceae sp. 2RAB30]